MHDLRSSRKGVTRVADLDRLEALTNLQDHVDTAKRHTISERLVGATRKSPELEIKRRINNYEFHEVEGGFDMAGEKETFIVRLEGKDIKSVSGKVKGRIQDYISHTHKFDGAEFSMHRRDGWIKVSGVSEEILTEALENAKANLARYERFDYEIISEEPEEDEDQTTVTTITTEEELDKRFAIWTQQAQKKWDLLEQGYLKELSRLQTEIQGFDQQKKGLLELTRREKERAEGLQKSYDEIYALYERLTAERVRPPAEAAKLWVSDWSKVVKRIEDELTAAGFDGRFKEIPELLNFTVDSLRSSVEKKVPAGVEVPHDLPGIEAIALVGSWEDTDTYKSLAHNYQRAKSEIQYIEDIKQGKVQVPESLKETFIKAVDLEKNNQIIAGFEAKERDHHKRNAAANQISAMVQRYRVAEAIRRLKASLKTENPFPVVLDCHKHDGKWTLQLLLPASEGTVQESYSECVKNAVEDSGLRSREDQASENLVSISWLLPGSVQSWKDASKKQDQFAFDFANTFKGCALQMLGVRMRMTKMMDVIPPTERVELKLPSHDNQAEVEPAGGHKAV